MLTTQKESFDFAQLSAAEVQVLLKKYNLVLTADEVLTIQNTILNSSSYGLYVRDYSFNENNTFYKNRLLNKGIAHAFDAGVDTRWNATDIGNQWDDGSEGNYWSDYNGKDILDDNIGDTPYNIPGGSSVDRYPLMDPGGHRKTPNNLIFIIITVILFGVVIMILMRLKKKGRETEQKTKPQPVLTQDQDDTLEE